MQLRDHVQVTSTFYEPGFRFNAHVSFNLCSNWALRDVPNAEIQLYLLRRGLSLFDTEVVSLWRKNRVHQGRRLYHSSGKFNMEVMIAVQEKSISCFNCFVVFQGDYTQIR